MITSQASVLLVKNAVTAATYYRDKLGFTCLHQVGEPPVFFIMQRDGCRLMLVEIQDPSRIVPHWQIHPKTSNVYFWVEDADALHREFVGRGASIDYGPCDQPYGCREFGIQDVDGYDIAFGQFIPPSP